MTPGREGPGHGGPAREGPRGDAAARLRAARLARWYPRQWRDRYGEEFTELLVSDIAERPDSLARTLDVARAGLLARLAGAGLTGCAPAGGPGGAGELAAARARHAAASLGTLGAATAVFLVVGAAQWSQLVIGWVWAARLRQQQPDSAPQLLAADRNATLGASAAILALLALAVLAALPVLATVAARLAGLPRPPPDDSCRTRALSISSCQSFRLRIDSGDLRARYVRYRTQKLIRSCPGMYIGGPETHLWRSPGRLDVA